MALTMWLLFGLAAFMLPSLAAAQTASAPASPALDTLAQGLAGQVRELVGGNVALPGDAAHPAQGGTGGTPRVEIEIGTLDPRLQLAPCQRIEPQLPPTTRLWGRSRVALQCVEGPRRWRVWLPVTVKVLAPAVVATRTLAAGTVLSAADLTLAEVDWAEQSVPPQADGDELAGRTLARAVPAGQPVRTGDLRQRQWFAAGDTVKVVAQGRGFAVSGIGQALNHGIEGRAVRVRTDNGRVLSATPIGERLVEINL